MGRRAPAAATAHVQAVVVHLRDYGEADSIVTLYGPQVGKIVAFARAARRSVRRFGGRLVLGAQLQCTMRPPAPGADLWTLVDIEQATLPAWLTVVPPRLRERLIGLYALDLFMTCTPEGAADAELNELLAATLRTDHIPLPHDYLARLHLALLRLSGVAPRFDHCIACGRVLEPAAAAGLVRGDAGLRCVSCLSRVALGPDDICGMTPAVRAQLQRRVGSSADADAAAVRATRWLVEAVFRKNIRSAAVLEQVLGLDAPG